MSWKGFWYLLTLICLCGALYAWINLNNPIMGIIGMICTICCYTSGFIEEKGDDGK